MAGFLVYHPKRTVTILGGAVVHHDPVGGNQDPYVWNDPFLHTYCHMPQMRPEVGETILWVSGDRWPDFTRLYCDLVFVIGAKFFWKDRNHISQNDPIVDSSVAYAEHYCRAHEHLFRRRRRFTLKATANSFQPQTQAGELIDVVPALLRSGLTLNQLRQGLLASRGSKPLRLEDEVEFVTRWLREHASIALYSCDIAKLQARRESAQRAQACGRVGSCKRKSQVLQGDSPRYRRQIPSRRGCFRD
jgi:hypothetical protein